MTKWDRSKVIVSSAFKKSANIDRQFSVIGRKYQYFEVPLLLASYLYMNNQLAAPLLMRGLISFCLFTCFLLSFAQDYQDVDVTITEYERINRIKKAGDELHKIVQSDEFLSFLVSKGHDIDFEELRIRRKDMIISDLDAYATSIGDVPGGIFQIWLVEINVLNEQIYLKDTAAFIVFQATKDWLEYRNYQIDFENDEDVYKWMKVYNHGFLINHLVEQLKKHRDLPGMFVMKPDVHEDHIKNMTFSSHVNKVTGEEILDHEEHKKFLQGIRNMWAKSKKHYLDFEIIILGAKSISKKYSEEHHIQLVYEDQNKQDVVFRVTTKNVFDRHHFQEN